MSQTELLQQNPRINLLHDRDMEPRSEETYLREARFSILASEIRNSSIPGERQNTFNECWNEIHKTIRISDDLPLLHTGSVEYHVLNGISNAQEASAANIPDAERAFFVADLSRVYFQFQRWTRCLPGIKPFYGK
jgi:ornithine decarboxylase